MALRVLYVTNNEMGLIADGRMTALPSERIAQYERASRQLEERHEWKSSGEGAQFMNKTNPYAGASSRTGQVTAVSPLNGQEMLYTAVFAESGGIYRKDYAQPDAAEGMVLGNIGLFVRELHARGDSVVFCADSTQGQRHIGMLQLDKPGYIFLTEGDTQDGNPFLSPDGQWVYYASAGFARNEAGAVVQLGPMGLLRVRADSTALEELEASEAFDYLRPKVGPDGSLYYIKRPYTLPPSQASLKSLLMMPVHFVVGFVRFFAMFGKLFSNAGQTPASPANGPVQVKNRSEEEATIDGVRVQIGKALRENEKQGDKHPGLVPRTWELIRQAPDGTKACLRRGVIDYDLTGDGGVVLTNGRHVLHLGADGTETLLAKRDMLLRVAVAPEA